jgi:hypothetical protein
MGPVENPNDDQWLMIGQQWAMMHENEEPTKGDVRANTHLFH